MKRNGITRLVFVFKKFVVKIPNFTYEHDHFLIGCRANWSERKCWQQWKGNYEVRNMLCPSLFCSWFGLIQIQARAKIMERDLYEVELIPFGDLTRDTKKENFGYYKGRIVCVDYA